MCHTCRILHLHQIHVGYRLENSQQCNNFNLYDWTCYSKCTLVTVCDRLNVMINSSCWRDMAGHTDKIVNNHLAYSLPVWDPLAEC